MNARLDNSKAIFSGEGHSLEVLSGVSEAFFFSPFVLYVTLVAPGVEYNGDGVIQEM